MEFADLLLNWKEWEDWPETEIFPPFVPDRSENPTSLARSACEVLCQPYPMEEAMDGLTTLLSARLQRSNVVLMLRTLGRAANRWRWFWDGFWRPLQQSLQRDCRSRPRGRLFWFVLDHVPCPLEEDSIFRSEIGQFADIDPMQVMPLPELAPLTREDVAQWLKEFGSDGQRIEVSRREAIAAEVTAEDGIPGHVFYRLQNVGFWA